MSCGSLIAGSATFQLGHLPFRTSKVPSCFCLEVIFKKAARPDSSPGDQALLRCRGERALIKKRPLSEEPAKLSANPGSLLSYSYGSAGQPAHAALMYRRGFFRRCPLRNPDHASLA